MTQLLLPLTLPEIFSDDNFFVSECNKNAYETVMDKGSWKSHALYLYGESSSGKSHLAYIWAKVNSATIITANNVSPETINSNCVIEDIESSADERSIFHLFNHCRDIGARLLITSRISAYALPFTLPDITSRLRACQQVSINPPDDALLAAILRKQFADRQLLVDDEIISYITTRCERSPQKINELVDNIDKSALTQSRSITIPFVRLFL